MGPLQAEFSSFDLQPAQPADFTHLDVPRGGTARQAEVSTKTYQWLLIIATFRSFEAPVNYSTLS